MKFILASYSRHGFLSRLGIVDLTSRPPRVESCSRRTEVSRWSLWAAVELMSTSGRRSSRSSLESSSVCCGWKSTESSLLSGWLSRALDRNHPFRIDVRDSWPAPSRRRPSRSITSNRGAVNRQLLSTGGQCPLWNVPVCGVCVCRGRPNSPRLSFPFWLFFFHLILWSPSSRWADEITRSTSGAASSQKTTARSMRLTWRKIPRPYLISKRTREEKKRGGGEREKRNWHTHTLEDETSARCTRSRRHLISLFDAPARETTKKRKTLVLFFLVLSSTCNYARSRLVLFFFFVGLLELFWWFFTYF